MISPECKGDIKWILSWLPKIITSIAILIGSFVAKSGVDKWQISNTSFNANANTNLNNNQQLVTLQNIQQVLKKISPPFAVISPEGRIMFQSGLEDYRLKINTTAFENGIKYIIEFAKDPGTVIFFSQNAAVPKKFKSGKVFSGLEYWKNLGNVLLSFLLNQWQNHLYSYPHLSTL